MVNDPKKTHHQKSTSLLKTSISLDDFTDNSTNLINNQTGITSPPSFYTKRPTKLHMTRFKLFPKRRPFLQSKTNHRISPLPVSHEQHPTLPNYSTTTSTQQDNSTTPTDNFFNNTLDNPVTDTPIKVYSKTNYPFFHYRFELQLILSPSFLLNTPLLLKQINFLFLLKK